MINVFDFVKGVGEKLFSKDDEAAASIKERILENNPGLKNLTVDYDDGNVTLCADCESVEAREKTVLMVGNVEGVNAVDALGMKIVPTEKPADQPSGQGADIPVAEPKVEFYEIQSGDTLSKIAKQYYGDAMQYPKIFEANREVIKDPDKIFVGQRIRIPLD